MVCTLFSDPKLELDCMRGGNLILVAREAALRRLLFCSKNNIVLISIA